MALGSDLIDGLRLLNAQQASGIATAGPISTKILANPALGLVAGRKVWDTVTGQWVTVVTATTVNVPESVIAEVSGGG